MSSSNYFKKHKNKGKNMSKKYLVTGGAGFIGSNLVNKLIKDNNEVVVVDNLYSGKKENVNPKAYLIERDIAKSPPHSLAVQILLLAGKDFDAIFHLAAIPRVQHSIAEPELTHKNNVDGTHNMLLIAKELGVKRFIFSSSSSIYGDLEEMPLREDMNPRPVSPYALHKFIGEQYCNMYYKLYGIQTISLRYFNVFGPRQDPNGEYACLIPKFMKLIYEEKTPVIFGDGEQTRDFTSVENVVYANILAATTNNEKCFGNTYNVGNGKNRSVNEVYEIIKEIVGKDIKAVHADPVIESRHTLASTTKIEKDLNWKPTVNFDEGMQKTWQYFKDKF